MVLSVTRFDSSDTARVAKVLEGVAGGLEPPHSAADSISAAVGAHNAEHWFVGTQDEALKERLRKARLLIPICSNALLTHTLLVQTPGVPLLFVAASGVSLEIPTLEQKAEAVRKSHRSSLPACPPGSQSARSVVPAHEREILQLRPGASTDVRTNVRFKRNTAKGPNPLSVKKRKQPAAQPGQAAEQAAQAGDGQKRKRRRRARGREGEQPEGGQE